MMKWSQNMRVEMILIEMSKVQEEQLRREVFMLA
jgi:hypothetical protein